MKYQKKYLRVAINGMGRIGRLIFRNILVHPRFEIVAINDVQEPKNIVYLLQNDTTYNDLVWPLTFKNKKIVVGNHIIKVFQEKKLQRLPWKSLKVDLIIDASGTIENELVAKSYLNSDIQRIIFTKPIENIKNIVFGVNHNLITANDKLISASSCTTNALSLVLNVFAKDNEIENGFFNTIHAPTSDQKVLDAPHDTDWRRGRSILNNIIPTESYANKGISYIFPKLKNKINGSSLRVPILTGSIIDLVLNLKKPIKQAELQTLFDDEIEHNDSLTLNNDFLVSSDIIGSTYGAIIDGKSLTINNKTAKILIWYDNESSYVHQIIKTIDYWAKLILTNNDQTKNK